MDRCAGPARRLQGARRPIARRPHRSAQSATARRRARSLVQGFAAFDNAWGSDAPGAAFFGAYTDPAADTLGCAQQVPVQLTALSTAMTDTADTYLGTELANTDLAGGATTA